jgi:signal transduction histidine kinase/ligand-binding sensor domain-containing protein/DNA-binding response OmpR family regulator
MLYLITLIISNMNSERYLNKTFLVWLLGMFTLLQSLNSTIHNDHFQNINLKDGLSHSLVSAIVEDDNGFIWIATQDGLDRYDGYSIKVYYAGEGNKNPKYSWTKNLFKDSYGQIWILFDQVGIERYNPETCIFYDYKNNPNDLHSISTNKTFTPTNFSCVFEDSDSSIWIATANGLNKYNREEDNFDVFQHNAEDKSSLFSNEVTYIAEDNNRILWIGTSNGLNYYDLNEHKMHRFTNNKDTNTVLNNSQITTILPQADGSVLVGTYFNGIKYIYSPFDNNKILISSHITNPLNKNFEATVFSLILTHDNRVIAGTQSGMYLMEKNDNSVNFKLIEETKGKAIYHIFEDSLHNIWVSPNKEHGIYKYNSDLTDYVYFAKNKDTPNQLTNQRVQFITQTSNGILWIGTEKDGVYKYDLYAKEFYLFDNNPARRININNNEVYSIFEDNNNTLWVGTKNGLNKINLNTGQKKIYQKKEELLTGVDYSYSENPSGNLVGVIKETEDHKLWIGYFDYKVSLFNPQTEIFTNFQHNKKNPESYLSWSQRAICITKEKEVFFGATNNGLCKLNEDKTSFTYYPVNSGKYDGTNDSWLNIIIEDKDGIIWIGTMSHGLNKYNRKTGKFEYFTKDENNPNSLPSNQIRCIMKPAIYGNDILWIGTDNGFTKFNKKNYTFTNYKTKEGHSGNVIHGIIEDDNGYLWMSSNKGLIKFDPVTETSHVYFQEDGIQGNEFNEGAYFKSAEGMLYFGGVNGITYFHPDSISTNPYFPKIQITDFKVFNHEVLPRDTINKRIILRKSIMYTDKIILTHDDKVISFNFTALHYAAPTKIKYKYQLEGLDKNAIEVNYKQRYINYTNIPTGEYKLKIWATNNDGIWLDEPKVLKIVMLPHIWEKWWFILSLIVIILLIFLAIMNIRIRMLRKQKQILKSQVEEQTKELKHTNKILEAKQTEVLHRNQEIAEQRDSLKKQNILLEKQKTEIQEMGEKLHKVDEMKLRFFTNISHEIRTPLTLILGPTEKLLSLKEVQHQPKIKDDIDIIYKNEKRLLRLINQLLDVRKIETGTLKLNIQKTDIISFLKSIVELFNPLSEENDIELNFISDTGKLELYFDTDKIEKIAANLLSNAFKHTPPKGRITLNVDSKVTRYNRSFIKISVTDTGKGIPEKHLPHIFDRFYQISAKSESGQIGAGIGLSICKDLIEVHKGVITAESIFGKGTTFNAYIPLSCETYDQNEFTKEPDKQITRDYTKSAIEVPVSNQKVSNEMNKNINHAYTVLIVEDNIEMSNFIAVSLSDQFNIIRAYDGFEGLKVAKEQLPDIIISDIMMPIMDGLELCEELKSYNLTSHIPVIILTAKTEDKYHLRGLKLGADDFITKPFNPNILHQKINNILEIRKKLAEKFSKDMDIIPSNINISEIDENFIEKIVKYIEENIDDSELNGDKLSFEMNMSKGNLYKKLKALTGMTVNIFIRTIRLKIAAKLLKNGNYNISEVAYSVGFNNPKYFSTCFSELFEISPKEYMNNSK